MQHLDPAIAAQRREEQRFHGERVEARHAERTAQPSGKGYDALNEFDRSHRRQNGRTPDLEALIFGSPDLIFGGSRPGPTPDQKTAEALGELLALAFIVDLVGSLPTTEPETQERITPFDAGDPPFFAFWKNLNAKLARTGRPEAGYKTARDAFNGGPTPVGALTFIGKAYDGLRAVPVSLSSFPRSYSGEYREVTAHGTRWHKVKNNSDLAISYETPEAAITGAQYQRDEKIAPSHR